MPAVLLKTSCWASRFRSAKRSVIAILERDPRCVMITLDPDSGAQNREILRAVNRAHDNKAGIYGAVLMEGLVRPGDAISLVV